jgi:hypothetical protein
MELSTVIAILIVGSLFGYLAYWLATFVRDPYASFGRTDKTTAALGSALQDLDRLIARPSLEHKVELENKVHKHDNDVGGE